MKKLLLSTRIAILLLLLFCTIQCKKGGEPLVVPGLWVKLNTPYIGSAQDIQFVNANTGYILGVDSMPDNNILLKTTDGGMHWEKISYTYRFLQDTADGVMFKLNVSPFNPDILFSGRNKIIRSTDGGHHWEKMDSATTAMIVPTSHVSYHFQDDQTIICLGDKLYRSTDTGFQWSTIPGQTGGFSSLGQLQFTSKQTGYAAGGGAYDGVNVGFMSKTVDGGNSWQNVNYPLHTEVLGMSFPDDLTGYLALNLYKGTLVSTISEGCALYKTTDGGITWVAVNELMQIGRAKAGGIRNMVFRNESEGFAGTSSGIYHTLDGGKNWKSDNVDSTTSYLLSFPTPACGYAVDMNGNVFKRVFW